MKSLFPLIAIILYVSFSSPTLAQESKKSTFTEKLFFKKLQRSDKNELKNLIESKSTKSLISKPGNSEDYIWFSNPWNHISNTAYSYNINGFLTEELKTDSVSGDNLTKITAAIDDHNNPTEYMFYEWNETEWELTFGLKTMYIYNNEDNIIEETTQFFEVGIWLNTDHKTYEYNQSGYLVKETGQDWENEMWVNDWKDEYTNGNQGEWLEIVYYNWEENDWLPDERDTDIVWYDWENFQVESATLQDWTGEWINHLKFSVEYTGNDYVATTEKFMDEYWVNYELETYSQSSAEEVTTYESYESNEWVNFQRYSIFYDNHGNNAGTRGETWAGGQWFITSENSNTYTYNDNNDITELVIKEWNWMTGDLENFKRYVYSNFQYFEADINDTSLLNDIKIFPNPLIDILIIDLNNEMIKGSSVEIINITGQKVYESTLPNQISTLELGFLPAGMYFIRLSTNTNEVDNFKILKD